MKISPSQAQRAHDIAQEISNLVAEFKDLARSVMSSGEYEQFKYNTLGHIEPGINKDTEWMTRYSSIRSLEQVAEDMEDEANPIDEDDENEPGNTDDDDDSFDDDDEKPVVDEA